MFIKCADKSVGKNQNSNDDFVFCGSIKNTCALGVLGDFQTGCDPEIRDYCLEQLKIFFSEKRNQWAFELTPNSDIIVTVAEKINTCLNEATNKYQFQNNDNNRTTLIVLIYDLIEKKIYFSINGDSGMAIIGSNKRPLKYIYEGDRTGSNSGAGSLPGKINFNENIMTREIDDTDVVVLFSDGLWRNTDEDKIDNKMPQIFYKHTMSEILQSLDKEIINHNSTKNVDDMSFVLMKSESQIRKKKSAVIPSEKKINFVKNQIISKCSEILLFKTESLVNKYLVKR